MNTGCSHCVINFHPEKEVCRYISYKRPNDPDQKSLDCCDNGAAWTNIFWLAAMTIISCWFKVLEAFLSASWSLLSYKIVQISYRIREVQSWHDENHF